MLLLIEHARTTKTFYMLMLYHQFLGFCRRETRSPWCLRSVHIFNLPSLSFSFYWNSFKRLFVCCFARHLFTWAFRHVVFARVSQECRNRTFRSQFSINPGQSDFVPPLSPPFSYLYLRFWGNPGYPSRITRSLTDLITKKFGYTPSF